MTAFAERVARLTGTAAHRLERLAGGDLSEVLLVRRDDGRLSVAKSGGAPATEAAMLRALADAGVPAPRVEGEHDGVLLLEHVPNDRVFSASAWRGIGEALRRLHARIGESYGWPVDYRIGTVELDNRRGQDWPRFWAEQRLVAAASLLDRPWRERIERLAGRIADLVPAAPPASHLHGDLWGGNILVEGGRLAALIDPACYFGDPEVDLAMLSLFDAPPPDFWAAYGEPAPGWPRRRCVYQLFPAILHLRLFGSGYAGMADRLLRALDA
ncbi:MAG: fructosamine kinase family protein [Alphaproteobacteria bacterium]|nr:fructosamine kinase family protein [Alphaproteobacteria bacterium]MBV9372754.1 fructosamine kinase family protein [Alphaproteobacteria bacterium]MBV9900765.1 fructosamine kinase family protein [Alphaproteobacteria bacterium]